MQAEAAFPDVTAFFMQQAGTVLFGLVFFFLYRQSRAIYFGLWAAAWALRFAAGILGYELLRTSHVGWLAPYATLEYGFVIVLVSAARAGFASGVKDWRTVLRLIGILPVFVTLVFVLGLHSRLAAYQASTALAISFAYLYNFVELRPAAGSGARVFRFSLLILAAAFMVHGAVFLYFLRSGASAWTAYLHNETYYDFALHCVLVFAAMAMWSESQMDRIRGIRAELDHLRRENQQVLDLDRLTGLFNQAALARRVEDAAGFEGVVAVCDMDRFKEVNDRYGHLVGDEILRNIGNLLRSSIRHEDEAYRWGGDEFVVLFRNQRADVARRRMSELEARLREFRVRGFGALPISFSWGAAEAWSRPLRDALDDADRDMYALKRTRAMEGAPKERPPAR